MNDDFHPPQQWHRATRNAPCTICGKPDWCAFTDDLVLCMRVESERPSRGDAGGWLHARTARPHRAPRRALRIPTQQPADFEALAKKFSDALTAEGFADLARQLGVTPHALLVTGAGWWQERAAWTWPMYDAEARVIGIRCRDARTHRKYAVPGSKQGVFLADCIRHSGRSPALVTEGPTDLCAAFDLGFTGVGRPSCTGGTKHLAKLTRGLHVVVVADRDEPGRHGARALAMALLPTVLSVRVIEPPAPHKDLRAWVQAGADHDAVQAVIDAAALQTIRVRIVR